MTKLYCPYQDCGFPINVLPSSGHGEHATCEMCNRTSMLNYNAPDRIIQDNQREIRVGGIKQLVRLGA